MQLIPRLALAATFVLALSAPADARSKLSDGQIKQRIIKQSVAAYPGNCACPYNSASNGSSCGRRSAWSRGGGYAPLCYAADVSRAQVKAYRASH
jgi:hypothetical protein